MEKSPSDDRLAHPGVIAGLAGMVRNVFGLLLSRIELAALELAEVRTALLKLALIFALGGIAAWFAVALWVALIVVATWDSMGWKILGIMAAFFTLITGAVFLYARAMLLQGKLSLPATMAELRNDRDALL